MANDSPIIRSTRPMDRRTMLRASLSGLAALATVGCSTTPVSRAVGLSPGTRRLAPVRVSADRVIRATAGLRPFRAPGFVVRAERFGETTVVHNYGHGGGGITLSWGSSHLASEIVADTGHRRIAVIGAGVMGLTTARLLQDRGFDVTLYARELTPNTTSNMSGGQWNPTSVFDFNQASPAFIEQFQRATRFAWRYYQNLAGSRYGVRWVENYVLLNSRPPEGLTGTRELVPEMFAEWTVLERGEHPFHTPFARRYVTMLVEPAIFLDTLSHDFLLRGGRIVVREFATVGDVVALEEPVVVNCTGIGAHALFGDDELVPVKGQLAVLVPQPEVDYITISGSFYAFPRSDGIVLGGSNERGNWSLDTDPVIIAGIVEGNRATFESMR
jgi:D-amino-acid oxidase